MSVPTSGRCSSGHARGELVERNTGTARRYMTRRAFLRAITAPIPRLHKYEFIGNLSQLASLLLLLKGDSGAKDRSCVSFDVFMVRESV
jgi:hypothetical protein